MLCVVRCTYYSFMVELFEIVCGIEKPTVILGKHPEISANLADPVDSVRIMTNQLKLKVQVKMRKQHNYYRFI